MEENKPTVTDAQAGNTDVIQSNAEAHLSLNELNTLAGRQEDNAFKSKEDALKYIEGLNRLVGDQRLAEDRRKAEQANDALSETERLRNEMDSLKKDLTKKDFLIGKPEAQEYLDIIEAYAEKNNLSLEQAWGDKFSTLIQPKDQEKTVIKSNQRITPVSSQHIEDLTARAKSGDTDSQEALVREMLFG